MPDRDSGRSRKDRPSRDRQDAERAQARQRAVAQQQADRAREEDLTGGLAFRDQADVESWLREVWPPWFGRPYPG